MDSLPGFINDSTAVIGLGVIGFALCGISVQKVAASGNWLNVPGILGSALGIMAVAIVAAVLLGKELPGIPGDRAALVLLATIVVMKLGIAAVFKLSA